MSWFAQSPSNLALIKYMGKIHSPLLVQKDPYQNQLKQAEKHCPLPKQCLQNLTQKNKELLLLKNKATNPSLSFTLNHFKSHVLIKESLTTSYQPFLKNPFKNKLYDCSQKMILKNNMTKTSQQKFLNFFKFLKTVFKIPGEYTVSSQNNFPLGVGAASSASSFSALTLAVYKLALDRSLLKKDLKNWTVKELAYISRVGSGSSCRSFFSPFCLWEGESVKPISLPWHNLHHQLVVVDCEPKTISSSLAHKRVKSSPLFKGRTKRAGQRLKHLTKAFREKNWTRCFEIAYQEFLDMHSLFKSSTPPFNYKTALSEKALTVIKNFWDKNKDGPLVTMDAGANIHLLYRPDQKTKKQEIKRLLSKHIILSSL